MREHAGTKPRRVPRLWTGALDVVRTTCLRLYIQGNPDPRPRKPGCWFFGIDDLILNFIWKDRLGIANHDGEHSWGRATRLQDSAGSGSGEEPVLSAGERAKNGTRVVWTDARGSEAPSGLGGAASAHVLSPGRRQGEATLTPRARGHHRRPCREGGRMLSTCTCTCARGTCKLRPLSGCPCEGRRLSGHCPWARTWGCDRQLLVWTRAASATVRQPLPTPQESLRGLDPTESKTVHTAVKLLRDLWVGPCRRTCPRARECA